MQWWQWKTGTPSNQRRAFAKRRTGTLVSLLLAMTLQKKESLSLWWWWSPRCHLSLLFALSMNKEKVLPQSWEERLIERLSLLWAVVVRGQEDALPTGPRHFENVVVVWLTMRLGRHLNFHRQQQQAPE